MSRCGSEASAIKRSNGRVFGRAYNGRKERDILSLWPKNGVGDVSHNYFMTLRKENVSEPGSVGKAQHCPSNQCNSAMESGLELSVKWGEEERSVDRQAGLQG